MDFEKLKIVLLYFLIGFVITIILDIWNRKSSGEDGKSNIDDDVLLYIVTILIWPLFAFFIVMALVFSFLYASIHTISHLIYPGTDKNTDE